MHWLCKLHWRLLWLCYEDDDDGDNNDNDIMLAKVQILYILILQYEYIFLFYSRTFMMLYVCNYDCAFLFSVSVHKKGVNANRSLMTQRNMLMLPSRWWWHRSIWAEAKIRSLSVLGSLSSCIVLLALYFCNFVLLYFCIFVFLYLVFLSLYR